MEIADSVYSADAVNAKANKIYDTTLKIIALAKEKGVSTYRAADAYAESIIHG